MIFILSYETLQNKYKHIQKENNENKRKITTLDNKILDLEEEIKLLKQMRKI